MNKIISSNISKFYILETEIDGEIKYMSNTVELVDDINKAAKFFLDNGFSGYTAKSNAEHWKDRIESKYNCVVSIIPGEKVTEIRLL